MLIQDLDYQRSTHQTSAAMAVVGGTSFVPVAFASLLATASANGNVIALANTYTFALTNAGSFAFKFRP